MMWDFKELQIKNFVLSTTEHIGEKNVGFWLHYSDNHLMQAAEMAQWVNCHSSKRT